MVKTPLIYVLILPCDSYLQPQLAEVVVKRDRKRCWDVMENMKHQGLPPNNVDLSYKVGQWRWMVVLGFS